MTAEPAITFLDLACAIGTDATHARTIDGNLRQLHRDAVTGRFLHGSLGWNPHRQRCRLSPDEYPRLAMERMATSICPRSSYLSRLKH